MTPEGRPVTGTLDRVVFALLLFVIVLTAIPYGAVQPWWREIFECLVFLIASLAAVHALVRKNWTLDVSLLPPLVGLVLFSVFQTLPWFSGAGPSSPRSSLSDDPYSSGLFAIQLFALILMSLLLQRYATGKARLRKVILVVIGVGVASAVFGILRKNLQQEP